MLDFCQKHRHFYVSKDSRPGETPCPKCVEEKAPPGESIPVVVGGQDFGRYHDYSALVLLLVKNRVADVIGVKVWPHVDYSLVVSDTVLIAKRENVKLLAIDATDAMIEPIQREYRRQGVRTEDVKFGEYTDWVNATGIREHGPVKHAMIEYARRALQDRLVNLPRDGLNATSDELLKQLREQEIIKGTITRTGLETESARVQYGHPSSQHDDLAWSFLMALYVARKWLSGGGGFLKPISQLTAKKE